MQCAVTPVQAGSLIIIIIIILLGAILKGRAGVVRTVDLQRVAQAAVGATLGK